MARYPLPQELVLRFELEVEVLLVLHDRRRAACRAHGAAELFGGVGRSALVAAVAVLVLGAALGADALHETVGEEHPAALAPELRSGLPGDPAGLLHRGEEQFRELLVLGRLGRIVVVEGDFEIREVLQVDRVCAGYEVLGLHALLARADHHGRTVRVVRADINAVVSAKLLETHPEVRLYVLHKVPEMYVAVGIRQRAGNYDSSFFRHVYPRLFPILYQKTPVSGDKVYVVGQ